MLFTYSDRSALTAFLAQTSAQMSIVVLQGGGSSSQIQSILNSTQCSVGKLDACQQTMTSLKSIVVSGGNVSDTSDATLDKLSTDWGIFDFSAYDYTMF